MNAQYVLPLSPSAAESPPCLIVNPKSYRASNGDLAAQAAALAVAHGAEILEADEPEKLKAGLDRMLARGQRRIIVLAGDGSVQALVDHLCQLPAGLPLPHLVILGGGRTNLTAADLGGSGALLKKLESALKHGGDLAPSHEYRHTLSIEQTPAAPRHGFFVAAASIDSAIRYVHHGRATGGWLRSSLVSTVFGVIKLAVQALLGQQPLGEYPALDVNAMPCGRLQGAMRVLIATTLLHREGLFNPYAERGQGLLRITAVTARARGFWRNLPRILLGRFTARMNVEHGYLSGRCDRIQVTGLSTYTLDGEKFETDPSRPVVISAGPRLAFLRP